MKLFFHTLVTLGFFFGLLQADETAPSPCGKSFIVTGSISHYTRPSDVKVEGDPNDGTFAEEVYGHSFTAKVAGLPAGTYTVEIDVAEVFCKGPGQRVMSITSGDTVLADNFDIYAAAGGFAKACKLRGTVKHQADSVGGPLSITFTGLRENAKFNSIHVLDSQGGGVACIKACDMVGVADMAATKVPQVSTPVIYTDADKPMDARIDDLIGRMSLGEKVSQLMNAAPAIPRLNVPDYDYWSECLHGVARNGHATVFPQAIAMSAAWDPDQMHRIGQVIAVEARAKYYQSQREGNHGNSHGLNFWAPNINIFRDPRWGRGQETYGEDPYLTGRNAVGFITGLQGDDPKYLEAMACAKHFAVHSGPEFGRGAFNVNPETRDLYETYLPQFQAAVQEGHVGAVMASYNAIYNVPDACNPWLLTDILRKTWGYRGHVVSDCGAVSNIAAAHRYAKSDAEGDALAIKAGLDLECGGSFHALTQSVAQGLVTEKEIDTALHRVLFIRFKLGLFDPPDRVPFSNIAMTEVESPEHLELARTVACESMVLLKNDHLLPLDKTKLKSIAVIGANADNDGMMYGNYNGEAGAPVNILKGIRSEVGDAVTVNFVKGCPLVIKPGDPDAESSPEFQQAIDAAKAADVVIYVGGLTADLEGEEGDIVIPGFFHGDRTRIELPEIQEHMLKALQATGKPVVFVNCTGSAIAMPWEAANLPAILQAWYPGGEGGAAVADVLFGKYNPSGRLPVTFYEKTEDLPDFTDYRMANRTYRYFTGKALFPFGFGLSYTSFQYLPVTPATDTVAKKGTLHLSVPVKNTGDRDGDEVVQVYLHDKDSTVPQPIRSLIAFKRIAVARGAMVNVKFDIPIDRFHYWSVEKKVYVVDPGKYDVEIGASSGDLRQTCEVTVK
jgi:beta-glucosidase